MKLHLFDIEGTIAPIDYVHDTMFPYSTERFFIFLEENQLSDETLNAILKENKADAVNGLYQSLLQKSSDPKDIATYLQFLVKIDRKSQPLKEIQGKIWKQGFESGDLKSVVYPDTLEYFRFLQQEKCQIMIYSSGSIEAQKLYLRYSDQGNLIPFINGHFDTTTGPKKESESYRRILEKTGNPSRPTFYTDITEEAEAAIAAGFNVFLVNRNKIEKSEHIFQEIHSFQELMKGN